MLIGSIKKYLEIALFFQIPTNYPLCFQHLLQQQNSLFLLILFLSRKAKSTEYYYIP